MKKLYLYILIVLICSCARKSNVAKDMDSIEIIDLFSEPESEIKSLSEITTELNYIRLQTTKNSLVGSIAKLITRNNRIYIKSRFNEILCFDSEGNFLHKLDKIGRGPEEYEYIADFDVSSINNKLLILSSDKVLIFNNTGREFIFDKSIKLNRPVPSRISMVPGTSNILLSIDPTSGSEISLSILINTNGDTLNLKPNYNKFEKVVKRITMLPNESQYSSEDNVCFKEESSDTVFSINKESNEFRPRLILDSHGQGYSARVKFDMEYAKDHGREIYRVFSIIEDPRYIVYTYEHNRSRNKMVFDKSSNKKFQIALKDAWKDDIIGGPVFDPNFCCEGKIYSVVEALTLKNYVNGEDFKNKQVMNPEKKEDLKKLADLLKETDNPILFIMTTKN